VWTRWALVGLWNHTSAADGLAERPLKMRELVRQDFVLAQPDDLVDEVHREMLRKSTENVVVVRRVAAHTDRDCAGERHSAAAAVADGGRDAGEKAAGSPQPVAGSWKPRAGGREPLACGW